MFSCFGASSSSSDEFLSTSSSESDSSEELPPDVSYSKAFANHNIDTRFCFLDFVVESQTDPTKFCNQLSAQASPAIPAAASPAAATKPEPKHGINVKSFANCQELKLCARYVPLRLTAEERELLVLLEGALDVSEYTGNVDVYGYGKLQKQEDGLSDFIGVLLGLLVSK